MPFPFSTVRIYAMLLVVMPVCAQDDLSFNSLGLVSGGYSVAYERNVGNGLAASLSATYKDGHWGFLSAALYPDNLEGMSDIGGGLGLTWYSSRDAIGWFGSLEVAAGHHAVRLKKESGNSDSLYTSGFYVTPGLNAGYKWVIARRFVLAPTLGLAYRFSTADYAKLRAGPEEGFPFQVTRGELESGDSGLEPLVGLNLGYRF